MRPIDADNYCENICRCNKEKCDLQKCPIHNAPTIETAPVIHGNIVYRHDIPHCSICRKVIDANSCYCKWCGAKMEGGAE